LQHFIHPKAAYRIFNFKMDNPNSAKIQQNRKMACYSKTLTERLHAGHKRKTLPKEKKLFGLCSVTTIILKWHFA